ncbi:MAG: hypothetical protein WC050_02950 [Candidatus Paceibacterota bacterium]
MRVRRNLPLAELIRASGVQVMNGDAADPNLFKTDGPDTDSVPDTIPLTQDCSAEVAIKMIGDKTVADFCELLAYAPSMPANKKVVALGTCVEIRGVMMSPYVSTCDWAPSLYLKRHDITLGPEIEVLVVERVSAR